MKIKKTFLSLEHLVGILNYYPKTFEFREKISEDAHVLLHPPPGTPLCEQ